MIVDPGYLWSDLYGVGRLTNLFDENGDETDDCDEARAAVIQLDRGDWLSMDLGVEGQA